LEIRDLENNFMGCLPDDICMRLTNFIQEKGVYEVYIFSIDKNEVKVFLKEIFKPSKYRHVSSFVNEDKNLEIEDEDFVPAQMEEPDLDLDSEKLLFSPEEVLTSPKKRRHSQVDEDEDDEDEDEDEDDDDKKTYQEYEE